MFCRSSCAILSPESGSPVCVLKAEPRAVIILAVAPPLLRFEEEEEEEEEAMTAMKQVVVLIRTTRATSGQGAKRLRTINHCQSIIFQCRSLAL